MKQVRARPHEKKDCPNAGKCVAYLGLYIR